MQIKIFTLPLTPTEAQIEEVNHFLRANKVIDIKKELAMVDGNSCWTMCVVYLADGATSTSFAGNKSTRVDYKSVLSEDAFRRFAAMRDVRKAIAEREALPAYAVFTDYELSEIAKIENVSLNKIMQIEGIGKKKTEKYGEEIILPLICNSTLPQQ